jgi:hypothetical protein
MNKNLVLRAVGLFYLTETMNMGDESLHEMDCELHQILLELNDVEIAAYQQLIEYRGALVQDL